MKKTIIRTDRRTGGKRQHSSTIQDKTTIHEPDESGDINLGEIFQENGAEKQSDGEMVLFKDQWDPVFLLKAEIKFNENFLKSRGLPFDVSKKYSIKSGGYLSLNRFIANSHDEVSGALIAAENLRDLHAALPLLEQNKMAEALPLIIHAVRETRTLVVADLEPLIHAENARLAPAKNARRFVLKRYNELQAEGVSKDSSAAIIKEELPELNKKNDPPHAVLSGRTIRDLLKTSGLAKLKKEFP